MESLYKFLIFSIWLLPWQSITAFLLYEGMTDESWPHQYSVFQVYTPTQKTENGACKRRILIPTCLASLRSYVWAKSHPTRGNLSHDIRFINDKVNQIKLINRRWQKTMALPMCQKQEAKTVDCSPQWMCNLVPSFLFIQGNKLDD